VAACEVSEAAPGLFEGDLAHIAVRTGDARGILGGRDILIRSKGSSSSQLPSMAGAPPAPTL